eukprot:128775-Amphidinium_carterae.1
MLLPVPQGHLRHFCNLSVASGNLTLGHPPMSQELHLHDSYKQFSFSLHLGGAFPAQGCKWKLLQFLHLAPSRKLLNGSSPSLLEHRLQYVERIRFLARSSKDVAYIHENQPRPITWLTPCIPTVVAGNMVCSLVASALWAPTAVAAFCRTVTLESRKSETIN